jgi:hypothetical protein
VRTLIKAVVVLGVIILAVGLEACSWSVPHQGFGSIPDYEQPYGSTGFVLVVGGAIIGGLGFFEPGRKTK